MSFRFGQTLLFIAFLLVSGFLVFYLGARFGPEAFWGINLDRTESRGILPTKVPNEEMEALLAQEQEGTQLVFDKLLKQGSDIPDELLVKADLKPLERKVSETKSLDEQPAILLATTKEAAAQISPPVNEIKKPTAENKPPVVDDKISENKPVQVAVSEKKQSDTQAKTLEKPPVVKNPQPKIDDKPKPPLEVASKTDLKNSDKVPVTVPEVTTPKPSTNSKGRYSLQVGSYANKEKAQQMVKQYQSKGLHARVGEISFPQKGVWYRVYVGQYSSSTDAEIARQKIHAEYQVMPVIVSSGPQ